jgi:DNA-binding SARP family transcriptional activator
MRVDVPGALALTVEDQEVAVPGAQRRAMLALLALAEATTVTTTELVDALRPDDPPVRASGALQSHVSRLRAHFGPAADRLTAHDDGCRLLLQPGELDVHPARDGLGAARSVAEDDPASGADRLDAEE